MRRILSATLCGLMALTATAQSRFTDDLHLFTRIGYNIGGTAPVGLPATIRKLNDYKLQPNLLLGIDARKPLGGSWSIIVGLHSEDKDMREDARVKNYHMEIVLGGQSLEGMFTGDVETVVRQWMITMPVLAGFNVTPKLTIKAGPYISYVFSHSFTGNAHNGYLRVGDPTGAKVELGNDEGTRGTYDFSGDMRRFLWGADVGIDWQYGRKWGLYADLAWGLNGVHHSNFHTIEQTLYPIFGSVGIIYKLK